MTTNPSTRRIGFRMAIALAALALVAVACGSDDATSSTTAVTTSTQAADTTAPTTAPPTTTASTTAAPSTTSAATTTEPPTTTTPPTSTAAPTTTAAPDTNSFADGSGCTPGTTGYLPDGEWFGYVSAATTGQLDFDLACWFTGNPAAAAATEDGEESPPPNDYYVRNVNPAVRTLAVASGAGVNWLPNTGDPSTEELVTYADWLTGRSGRAYQPGAWLVIEGGAIIEIQEQYVP